MNTPTQGMAMNERANYHAKKLQELFIQYNNGYHVSRDDMEQAENAISFFENILIDLNEKQGE